MTITLTREEAQQVLDALDEYRDSTEDFRVANRCILLIETLRARLSAPEPEHRDVVIKGDLWRVEFLPDHAASVVLVRANYEAQPEPEPVAWMDEEGFTWTGNEFPHEHKGKCKPLYTAPPQREEGCAECGKKSSDGWALYCVKCSEREWQGLTDEEKKAIYEKADAENWHDQPLLEAIEAKLKEKNT
jgi:hypothetical protein